MATITAPGAGSNDLPPRSSGSAPRPLWHAPVFVLGVAALVGMAVVRPFAPDSPTRRITRDLERARQILSRSDGDADYALTLARPALENDELQDRIGEAAFLVGTAHMRLAEKAGPSRAPEAWKRSWQYLDQAEKEKASLPDSDQPHLLYRLGKVGFHTGDDLHRVINRLEESVTRTDNRAEGYALLTQAYLRLQPPDLQKALASNQKLRDVADVSESQLTAAKLLGGELLLRLGKPEEARRSLKQIPEQAPADILIRSRLATARSYQEEKQWAEACKLYRVALEDKRAPITEPGQVWYNLGVCYRNQEQPIEAAKAWQECVRLAKGVEGPAAQLVLADLRLLEGANDSALQSLIAAVAGIRSPADWNNPLIDVGRVLAAFKRAQEAFRKAGRYDLAMQLVEPFGKLAPPLEALLLRGEVSLEWAAVKQEAIRAMPSAEGEKEVLQLYAKAAEAYGDAAQLPGLKPVEQGKYLWASAMAYLSARDPVKAADRLEKFVKLDVEAEKLGEAYYRLGEIYRDGKDSREAVANYNKCTRMRNPTRFAYLARYQLAMADLERGDSDEAQAKLQINISDLRYDEDPEALAQSLFELGNLLYLRKDYTWVCRHLERALLKFKENPQYKDNAEVTRARFQLADSYRQIAAQENQSFILRETMSDETRAHHHKEHRRLLQQAAEEFASLDAYLDSPAGKEQLTKDQRGQVPFITAKCWFNLGMYDKALAIYKRLIERYPEQVEGLEALGGAISCHAALGQIDYVRQRLLQINTLLPKMPPEIREPWEEWVKKASEPLADL